MLHCKLMKPFRNALAALAALATLAVLVVIAALAGERARKVIAVTLLSAIVCAAAASTAVIVRGGGKRKKLTTEYDVWGSDFDEDSADESDQVDVVGTATDLPALQDFFAVFYEPGETPQNIRAMIERFVVECIELSKTAKYAGWETRYQLLGKMLLQLMARGGQMLIADEDAEWNSFARRHNRARRIFVRLWKDQNIPLGSEDEIVDVLKLLTSETAATLYLTWVRAWDVGWSGQAPLDSELQSDFAILHENDFKNVYRYLHRNPKGYLNAGRGNKLMISKPEESYDFSFEMDFNQGPIYNYLMSVTDKMFRTIKIARVVLMKRKAKQQGAKRRKTKP